MTDHDMDGRTTAKLLHEAHAIIGVLTQRIMAQEDKDFWQLENLRRRIDGFVERLPATRPQLDGSPWGNTGLFRSPLFDRPMGLEEALELSRPIVPDSSPVPDIQGISGRHQRLLPFGVGFESGIHDR